MNTVGELRKALESCPDDVLVGVSTRAPNHDAGSWDVDIDYDCGVTIYAVEP